MVAFGSFEPGHIMQVTFFFSEVEKESDIMMMIMFYLRKIHNILLYISQKNLFLGQGTADSAGSDWDSERPTIGLLQNSF